MPIYCYKCYNCGHQLEQFRWSSEGHLKVCPECGGEISRDYASETPTVFSDYEPGFNWSIMEPYTSRQDILTKIKRRGLMPYTSAGGIHSSRAKPGFYGDEEFKEAYTPSEPQHSEIEIPDD